MSTFSQSELEELSRKDLQALAKKHGIKANLKSSAIVDQLLEILKPAKGAATPVEEDKENDAPSPQVTKVVAMTVEKEVPPSPMQKIAQIKVPASPSLAQKIVKNAFIALTPHKTPAKTPAKSVAPPTGSKTPGRVQAQTMVTPRKNLVKKNLFGQPTKGPKENLAKKTPAKSESPETKLFEELLAKIQDSPLTDIFGFQEIYALFVCYKPPESFWVSDFSTVHLIQTLVTFLTHELLARCMAVEGSTERTGFVLKTEVLEKAIEATFTGSLSEYALTEARNAQSRYHEDSSRIAVALICDYETTLSFLENLGFVATAEVAVALTASLEYLMLEVWELCEGTEHTDYSVVRPHDVLDGIDGDSELQTTFKAALEEHNKKQARKDLDIKRISSIVKAEEGAKVTEILALGNKLRFAVPSNLETFLKLQNGSVPFKVDDCEKISASAEFYPAFDFVFSVLNWIPIFFHDDNETWDCLTDSGLVIRASLLTGTGAAEDFPVVAESFGQYLELAQKTPTKAVEATQNLFGKVDPEAAGWADFWLTTIDKDEEEEEDEEEKMNLD